MSSEQYLILLSILGWGIGSIFYKIANDNIHPLMVSTIITIMYIILTPIPFIFMKFDHSINSVGFIFSILGGLCMCVGSLGYFYALRTSNVGVVTTMTSLYPALTLLLSFLFLKETIHWKQGFGIMLALISFALLSSKK